MSNKRVSSGAIGAEDATAAGMDVAAIPKVPVGEELSTPERDVVTTVRACSADGILLQMITFQGWLSRFSSSSVRVAFLAGRITSGDCSDAMLVSLDKIRELMLPSPFRRDKDAAELASAGRIFFTKFVEKRQVEPVDLDGRVFPVRMSYDSWYGYLGELSVSEYWQCSEELATEWDDRSKPTTSDIRPAVGLTGMSQLSRDGERQERKRAAAVPSKFEFLSKTAGKQMSGSDEADWGTKNDHYDYNKRSRYQDENRMKTMRSSLEWRPESGKTSVRPRQKLPAKCTVDMDEDLEGEMFRMSLHESTTRSRSPWRSFPEPRRRDNENLKYLPRIADSCSDADVDSDEGEHIRSKDRDWYKLMCSMGRHREVVSPGTFNGKDGTSLREFLEDFERYFSAKYDGNDRQQSKVLFQHLEGPAKRAFEAMDGLRLRYSHLKPELLHWYNGEKISLRNRSEGQFRRARFETSDSLRIYALRLERLAARAYPESLRERDRQLCRKFWKTVPDDFRSVLASSERSLALYDRGHKLSWTDMVRLAESEDRHRRDRREEVSSQSEPEEDYGIWYSRDVASQPRIGTKMKDRNSGRNVSFGPSTTIVNTREIDRTSSSPPRDQTTWSICNWCGRRGHQEEYCWMKNGLCLICGSRQHEKRTCPKYDADWKGFAPSCSRCKGEHLGKDCDQLN